jgi:restriction system protein
MPIPGYQSFHRPLLELAADGGEHLFRHAVEQMATRFAVTPEERETLIPSGTQRLLDNRVGWSKTYLVKAGLLEAPRRGVFRITERGRQALADGGDINFRYLRQFPEFVDFVGARETEAGVAEAAAVGPQLTSETTPEELVEAGYQQLSRALASELRERLKLCSPPFFERVVVQLLVAMGYGGSLSDAGQAIGKSGDEGLDGIIKEDRLGLDVIYVQAKRWQATVGRPDIQQFAGALQGQRARKGVFITTSSFSAEARDYAARIDTRIVLIDGDELAKLMINHSVGVATAATYELKRVDSDYFIEEE